MPQVVQVYGLKELHKALLKTVPEHFQGRVLQAALSAGARPVVATAKALVPVKTGALRRSIYQTRDKRNSSGIYEQRIVTVRRGKKEQKRSRDGFHWRWIEFGRQAVVATNAKVLGTPQKGFFGKSVALAKPRPFLRPAFAQNKFTALRQIQLSLAKEIPKAARKASWRTPFSQSSGFSALRGR